MVDRGRDTDGNIRNPLGRTHHRAYRTEVCMTMARLYTMAGFIVGCLVGMLAVALSPLLD